MKLDKTNAKSFNASLKKALEVITGQKCTVEIINSYNFLKKNCWVRVHVPRGGNDFTNEFRLAVFDGCGYDRKGLLYPEDVCYGNIMSRCISAHVTEWEKIVETFNANNIELSFLQ